MAVYAIGDIQGCYSALCRLLEHIRFDQGSDTLWFCGDLVNRGPDSLQTLRFIRALGCNAITVLGNHDLHLLALSSSGKKLRVSDSLYQVLASPDCDELLTWLRHRPLAHYDPSLDTLMVHAGIHPEWSIEQVLGYAQEIEQILKEGNTASYFELMYGDKPDYWSEQLTGTDRQRCITNILTRMRFMTTDLRLDFKENAGPDNNKNENLKPWFEMPANDRGYTRTVFGHWSTLPTGAYGRHYALDQGCVWGGGLTALQLDLTEPRWFSIDC